VLGDSIAAGHPLEAPDRWTDRFAETLRGALPDRVVEVLNVASRGAGIDSLEASVGAQQDLADFQVAIVIEGVNDVGVTPIDGWARRYRMVVETLERRGVVVVVGTAPPAFGSGQFFDTYDQVASTLRSIAAEGQRPLLDIEGNWREIGPKKAESFYVDVIHQNAAGQALMADRASSLTLAIPEVC
jgi:lysophospholipase L1-like esterase